MTQTSDRTESPVPPYLREPATPGGLLDRPPYRSELLDRRRRSVTGSAGGPLGGSERRTTVVGLNPAPKSISLVDIPPQNEETA
jgi:hypothetical protein